MTTDDRFGPALSRWLTEEAEHRVPGHLAEVLVQTAAARQRPWWSSLERLFPMTTTTMGGRVAAPSPILLIVLLGLLVTAVVGAALLGSSTPPRIGPGLAANGLLAYADGTSIRVVGPDGTGVRTLVADVPHPTNLAWSPDGARLAFRTVASGGTVELVAADGSGRLTIPAPSGTFDDLAWSPDSRSLAFSRESGSVPDLVIASTDGATRLLVDGPHPPPRARMHPSWSPDGSTIAFVAGPIPDTGSRYLGIVGADGTGEQLLEVPMPSSDGAVGWAGWSPDAARRQLLYTSGDNAGSPSMVRLHDVDSGRDVVVGIGFWPSWSPDGSSIAWFGDGPRIASVDEVLAAGHAIVGRAVQPSASGEYCQDNADLAGRAICSPASWSPDGRWVYGPDVLGTSVVALPLAGGTPIRVPLERPVDLTVGPTYPAAWQRVAP